MSDEHDSWFKKAFGLDLGDSLKKIEGEAKAMANQAANTVSQAVQDARAKVEAGLDGVAKGAAAIAKKVAGAASGATGGTSGGSKGATGAPAGGGTGSFPLGGSVGRGGKNAPNDVRAVQTALGIAADGNCGSQTISAIEAFQRKLGQARPDGRVDAGGATEKALAGGGKVANATPPTPSGPPNDASKTGDDDGILGGLAKRAGEMFDGAKDLGGKIVEGAKQVLSDPNAFLNQSKKPSYIANPNTPPGLQGGGTASAGDSAFVTGGQQGQLLARVKGIYSAAAALNQTAKGLQEKGTHKYWWDDDQLLQSARNLQATAGAMVKLAQSIDSWTGDSNKGALEKGSTALDHVDKVIKACEAVAAIRALNLSSAQMADKTNEATVNQWADDVGNAFDKAGALIDLIPKGALPGFVVDYYKGLFSAPKNYIAAFKTMLRVHYGSIDKEAGISGANKRAEDLGKTGLDWEGDLSGVFISGFMLPKTKTGEEFQRYMLRRRKSENVDLFKVTVTVGKAVLLAAIDRDLADDDPAKAAWVAYVGRA